MHANENFFEYLAFGTGDIANFQKKKKKKEEKKKKDA